MDVRMPDGTLVKNVPEGTTQADLLARYRQHKIDAGLSEMKASVTGPVEAGVVAAGKGADDIVQGVKQGALEASGDTAGADALAAAQAEKARLYAPLKAQHPVATGVGEAAPMLAVPGGQATALGRVMAPAVANAAIEGLKYGTADERKNRAFFGGITGVGGGVAGEGVRAAFSPFRSILTGDKQAAVRAAESGLGVKARPSQLTGNQNLANIEDALAQSPGGAGVWRDFNEANRSVINRAAARAIGSNADAPTRDVLAAQKSALGAEYDALRAATKMPVVGDIFDAINGAETMLNRGANIKGKGEALGILSDLKERLWNTKELSGADYQTWASDLSTIARSTDNGTVRAAVRSVEKAMDKVARQGNAQRWQEADAAWASLKTLLRPGAVNEVTGDVSPRGVASALQVTGKEGVKTGALKGPMMDIADFGKALPAIREGSQTARRGAFTDLMSLAMSPANWAASKALTSDFGRRYVSGGLLGNPELSQRLGGLLGKGAVPLSIAELELLLGARQ